MAIFSNGQSTRSRVGRVAQFELGPKRFEQLTKSLQRSGVLGRFTVVLCAAAAMWMINLSWRPPFPYRLSQIPPRDIVTRVSFTQVDVVKTREAKDRARRSIECVYRNDPQPLVELRAALRGRLSRMLNAESAAEFDDVLQEFEMRAEVDPRPGSATDAGSEFTDASANVAAPMESSFSLDNFEGFQAAFAADPRLENLEHELDDAFAEVERFGLLRELQHDVTDGSRSEITIRSATDEKDEPRVALETVRMTEAVPQLKKSLDNTLSTPGLAALIFPWLKPQLPETLTLDRDATRQAERRALEKVSDVLMHFEAGKDVLATAGHPLTSTEMGLLRLEYDTRLQHVTWRESLIRSFGAAGMYLAVFVLCGTYLFWRDSPLLQVTRKFHTLLGLAVTTLGLARVCSQDPWHAELVPLMMFGITVGIAYRHEVAFLLVASICLLVTLGLGQDLAYFVTYAATMASTVFLLKNIRSRTKLVYIGLWAALVAALTTLGVYAIGDGPIDVSWFQLAGWHALLAVVAGMLMTALLPFVEQLMEVQTEISLLELGDVAHPLLQELARRRLARIITRCPWRRSLRRPPRISAQMACWYAWGPISTTSARCSNLSTSSKIRSKVPVVTIHCYPP